jgi:hypothetical protein
VEIPWKIRWGEKTEKPLLISQEGAFFTREGVDPVDMDCDLDDADMGMAIMKSLKILMKNHGKFQLLKGENDE